MNRLTGLLCLTFAVLIFAAAEPAWAMHEQGKFHKKKKIKIEIVYPPGAPGIAAHFKSRLGINGKSRDAGSLHQGIDIKGPNGQAILAAADGMVLEAVVDECWGPTISIDHGNGPDGGKIIALYGHVGEMLVEAGHEVKRGQLIAKLGDNQNRYKCMAGVRHLHFQLGREYQTDKSDRWGNEYFLEDGRRGLNPHLYWVDGVRKVTCFSPAKIYPADYLAYPLPCDRQ
jgi:murein DD-endopeptidase MepM/ murein hydrolase activator NlpD